MKFSLVAVVFAAVAMAQPHSQTTKSHAPSKTKSKPTPTPTPTIQVNIPQCAISCLEQGIRKNTKCAVNDYKCICKHQDKAFDDKAKKCVVKSCGKKTTEKKVLPAAKVICEAA